MKKNKEFSRKQFFKVFTRQFIDGINDTSSERFSQSENADLSDRTSSEQVQKDQKSDSIKKLKKTKSKKTKTIPKKTIKEKEYSNAIRPPGANQNIKKLIKIT